MVCLTFFACPVNLTVKWFCCQDTGFPFKKVEGRGGTLVPMMLGVNTISVHILTTFPNKKSFFLEIPKNHFF
jgi:hypothetical protein